MPAECRETRSSLMRIDPRTPAAAPGTPSTQRRAPAGQRFLLESGGASAKTPAVLASAPLATVDALLALQEQGDPGERRRRSITRGHEVLDALDRLKAALLSGRIASNDLQRLAAKLAERRDLTDDPRLDDLIAHIELRAKVELAKLGVR